MSGHRISRRTVLSGTAVAFASLAGCSGQPPAESGGDGSGTADRSTSTTSDGDTTSDDGNYETVSVEGTQVPLVPIDDAVDWFRDDAAKFVDARSQAAYAEAHIEGAALSPAPDGQSSGDPVAEWSQSTRIVTYCGCPHHLSSMRGASLIDGGYGNVYALDEGFWEWHDRGYPMAGSEVNRKPPATELRGRTDERYAGETVWATHLDSGRMEAGPIADDGTYALELRFADVTPESTIRVETPAYVVEGPLGDLAAGVIEG